MNKLIIPALATMAVLSISSLVMMNLTYQIVEAQYDAGTLGGSLGTATPEQLAECEQLGIIRENCNDITILAKKRLTAAQENPAEGSGTPMLSTETGQMTVFIGVLAAIFGGVAAAFFIKGRGARPVKT
jgi:hypothetical protein